jgi:mRNA interferase MazF
MWKTRPVIVVSYKNSLHGPCLVVPTSTEPHEEADPWAFRLSVKLDGVQSWAICNMLTTVSPSRFSQFRGEIPVLPQADFNEVLARVTRWLPKPFPLDNEPGVSKLPCVRGPGDGCPLPERETLPGRLARAALGLSGTMVQLATRHHRSSVSPRPWIPLALASAINTSSAVRQNLTFSALLTGGAGPARRNANAPGSSSD